MNNNKFGLILYTIIILLNGVLIGFILGKHYVNHKLVNNDAIKAASLFSDAIRIEYDNIDEEDKNCTFCAYSVLEEFCCEENIDTDSLLNKY